MPIPPRQHPPQPNPIERSPGAIDGGAPTGGWLNSGKKRQKNNLSHQALLSDEQSAPAVLPQPSCTRPENAQHTTEHMHHRQMLRCLAWLN